MSLSSVSDVLVARLLRALFYGIGRVVLPVVTLGRARTASLRDVNDNLSFPWHGIAKSRDGKYVLSPAATSEFGFLCLGLLIVLGRILGPIFYRAIFLGGHGGPWPTGS